ncbi:MAG: GlxA family transcriptional regulator, partial [Pseudomonadota bacterium]
MLVTPHFNMATTSAFLDPLRAANYLLGDTKFQWVLASLAGSDILSSNGMSVATVPVGRLAANRPDIVVVSSSWTPESHFTSELSS